MTKHILLALALATSAYAHGWDGKTFSVALTGDDGQGNASDTWTFANGQVTSEWLSREGFTATSYESDDDDFEARFKKGDDEVEIRGEIEDGKLEGNVKWRKHHEGGRKRWNFVETAAGAAAPAAPAVAPAHSH